MGDVAEQMEGQALVAWLTVTDFLGLHVATRPLRDVTSVLHRIDGEIKRHIEMDDDD